MSESCDSFHIGATDTVTEGEFVFQDGSPMTYSDFANGEPNDYYGEDHLVVDGFLWNDNSGGVDLCPMCKMGMIPGRVAGT